MKKDKTYLFLLSLVYVSFVIVFCFFPRSTFSELEKRELTSFPAFTAESLADGSFTTGVNHWFSDTEPFRDFFMKTNLQQKKLMAWTFPRGDEEEVVFHATNDGAAAAEETNAPTDLGELTADDKAKIANNGIIIVGSGDKVRALMAYGGGPNGGVSYAEAANAYHNALGSAVRIYCMVIPTAAAFYCPEKAKTKTRDQEATIRNIHNHLEPGVVAVDAFNALKAHAKENIYLRTDHHWAPLGAFYAAQEFCRMAGVPFKPLSAYQQKVVHRFVGSMYGYSQDLSIKEHPEDFVYYVPQGLNYQVWFTDYEINKNYEVVAEKKPYKGRFFQHYPDGHGGAYCTFMGGDTRIVKVVTGTNSSRRVLILKDSFGNAIPGYLFYSFGEVHVVDFRYFTHNMKQYVQQNGITDILFAHNIFNAYSPHVGKRYVKYLKQANGTFAPRTDKKTAADSLHKEHRTKPAEEHKAKTPEEKKPAEEKKEQEKPEENTNS